MGVPFGKGAGDVWFGLDLDPLVDSSRRVDGDVREDWSLAALMLMVTSEYNLGSTPSSALFLRSIAVSMPALQGSVGLGEKNTEI